MKYIVNLTHKTTGKGKVRKVNAETMESAHNMVAKRYPEYDVGRIYADTDASVSTLYQIMKEAKREAK